MKTIDVSGIHCVFEEILAEYVEARRKHAPMRGPHEGYAVILEELDELWDEVRHREPNGRVMHKEAVQVAAMAAAFVLEVAPNREG